MAAPKLVEVASDLIIAWIKQNISAALSSVRTDRNDPRVTTEEPKNYFIYEKAISFKTPAVFVICRDMNFMKPERGANHINALCDYGISILVEDRDAEHLTRKAWRYQAALQSLLDEAQLENPDQTLKLVIKVKSATFSPVFTSAGEKPDNFRKEIVLNCDVDHFEAI